MSVEITQGHTQTEAGVIPEEWRVVQLGNYVKITSGASPSLFEFCSDGTPYFKVEQLGNTEKYLHSESTPYHFKTGPKIQRDSIVFAKRGAAIALNKIRILGEESFMDTNLMALTPQNGLNSDYLFYTLSYLGLWRFSDITSIPQINNKHITPILLSLPGEAEQSRIASALSDIDALVSNLDRFIAKKRDIKQAAIQQLLTGQKRLPGFSGAWEVKRLGEIGLFIKGSGITRDQSNSGHLPCVRYGEIYTAHHDVIREFQSFISKEVAVTATALKQGDLLFAGSGETKAEIGKCVAFVHEIEAYAGGDIVILRPVNADSMFLGYALNTQSICRQKASRGQGDAVVHISANALSTVEITLPAKEEQTAIATILSDIDMELAALEARRDKARQLKQGMMQELLTGRIRLLDKESA